MSPLSRCHPQHLSVALSFLGVRDFAVAARVCRTLFEAAQLKSAWPPQPSLDVHLAEMDSGRLILPPFTPARLPGGGNLDPYRDSLASVGFGRLWAHLSALNIFLCSWSNPAPTSPIDDAVLDAIGQLPLLSQLTLRLQAVSADAVQRCLTKLAPHLTVLHVPAGYRNVQTLFVSHVHLLSNLRILAIGCLEGCAIGELHQLESLQVDEEFSEPLLGQLLDLSIHHKLRHLCFMPGKLDGAIARLRAGDAVGLLSVQVRRVHNQSVLQFLFSLPRLLRVHFPDGVDAAIKQGDFPVSLTLRSVTVDPAWEVESMGSALTELAKHAPNLSSLQLPFPGDCDDALAMFPSLTELDGRGPLTSTRLSALVAHSKVAQSFRLLVKSRVALPPFNVDQLGDSILLRPSTEIILAPALDASGRGEGSRTEDDSTQSFALSAAEASAYVSMRAAECKNPKATRALISLQRGEDQSIVSWSAREYVVS